ncbi:hypothetical protein EO98_01120 [Methanosarcina sp. 2.H.T.1A.6]|uniref:DUF1269 domain-containing protein n=1 Tax=unclassified Methanosarcina TaxID=2644672 RepID=UPI000622498E|nr:MULTISPECIES: DUF1269 domain-containing protein [unclassified Methanosarcina]KKG13922.1 hypothetical protein EO94_19585 [Methanosarcina sp. 2.H.T.1A.3]KKG19120.1 hypothetical protein EO97_17575 [Methanosarcina sp. 2.H.T.1A.15]KKG25113.1 hypothetical protein EO98_01120 [Methanosarcina sp. 2.H.T.1A.6]KKG27016.1 hypothetical protein EO96_11370 [Methanosarcina sp. 2.H.T.1A.8]
MGKEETSKVYNIVALCFEGQKKAEEILKEVKSKGILDKYEIVAQAVVEHDEKGKVHVHEPGRGVFGAAIGAVGGGILSLIGGPVGLLSWVVGGAVVGGVAGKYLGRPIKKGNLEELGNALKPNSSALLLLLENIYSEEVINKMSGFNARVVTLTMGDELSGEITAFATGEVEEAPAQ